MDLTFFSIGPFFMRVKPSFWTFHEIVFQLISNHKMCFCSSKTLNGITKTLYFYFCRFNFLVVLIAGIENLEYTDFKYRRIFLGVQPKKILGAPKVAFFCVCKNNQKVPTKYENPRDSFNISVSRFESRIFSFKYVF